MSSTARISPASAAIQSVPGARSSQGAFNPGARSAHKRRESAVRASCAGESSITTMCPMPAAVAPLPGNAVSHTITRNPARANS